MISSTKSWCFKLPTFSKKFRWGCLFLILKFAPLCDPYVWTAILTIWNYVMLMSFYEHSTFSFQENLQRFDIVLILLCRSSARQDRSSHKKEGADLLADLLKKVAGKLNTFANDGQYSSSGWQPKIRWSWNGKGSHMRRNISTRSNWR